MPSTPDWCVLTQVSSPVRMFHSRMLGPLNARATNRPLGEIAMLNPDQDSCSEFPSPARRPISLLSRIAYHTTPPSLCTETMRPESTQNPIAYAPYGTTTLSPVARSQTMIVFAEAEARYLLSGENARQDTYFRWPSK